MTSKMVLFFQKHAGSLMTLALSTIMALFLLVWLGFDLRYIGEAYLGQSNDIGPSFYYVYQALENLVTWPIDLGTSLLFSTEPDTFGYTVAPYGVALPYVPLYLLSGHNYLLTYNVHIISTFVLTAWISFLLIRYLFNTPSRFAIFGALVLAFSPYRLTHLELAHPAHLSTHYFLFALYALHRMLDDQKMRWTVLMAVSMFLMITSSGYYAIVFLIGGGIVVLFAWVQNPKTISRKFILHSLFAIMLVSVLSFPFISIRFGNDMLSSGQDLWAKIYNSASAENFISGSSLLYRNRFIWEGENNTFFGFIPLGLTLFVWLKYRDISKEEKTEGRTFSTEQLILLYILIFLAGAILGMGPRLKTTFHIVLPVPLPYSLLMNLPGFSAMRAVVRFVMMSMIVSSVFSAIGLATILQRVKKVWVQNFLLILISIGVVIEFLPPPKTLDQILIPLPVNTEANPMSFIEAFSTPKEERIFYPVFPPTDQAITLWLAEQPANTLVWHYPPKNLVGVYFMGLPIHKQLMVNGEMSTFRPTWNEPLLNSGFPASETFSILQEHSVNYVLVYLEKMTEAERNDFYERLKMFEAEGNVVPLVGTFDAVEVYEILP